MFSSILLFLAFLLLLLVSLSVPIIKSIFLFKLVAHATESFLSATASASATFGVWGYCVSAVDISVASFSHDTSAFCSKPKLGYTFDPTLAKDLHVSGFDNLISHALTLGLALHPVACVLTFIAFLISLTTIRRGTARLPSFFTLSFGLLAALFTTIAFLIDIIFVALVRNKVHKDTDNILTLSWGNAVWMILGAMIAIWLAMIAAFTGIFAYSGKKSSTTPETA